MTTLPRDSFDANVLRTSTIGCAQGVWLMCLVFSCVWLSFGYQARRDSRGADPAVFESVGERCRIDGVSYRTETLGHTIGRSTAYYSCTEFWTYDFVVLGVNGEEDGDEEELVIYRTSEVWSKSCRKAACSRCSRMNGPNAFEGSPIQLGEFVTECWASKSPGASTIPLWGCSEQPGDDCYLLYDPKVTFESNEEEESRDILIGWMLFVPVALLSLLFFVIYALPRMTAKWRAQVSRGGGGGESEEEAKEEEVEEGKEEEEIDSRPIPYLTAFDDGAHYTSGPARLERGSVEWRMMGSVTLPTSPRQRVAISAPMVFKTEENAWVVTSSTFMLPNGSFSDCLDRPPPLVHWDFESVRQMSKHTKWQNFGVRQGEPGGGESATSSDVGEEIGQEDLIVWATSSVGEDAIELWGDKGLNFMAHDNEGGVVVQMGALSRSTKQVRAVLRSYDGLGNLCGVALQEGTVVSFVDLDEQTIAQKQQETREGRFASLVSETIRITTGGAPDL